MKEVIGRSLQIGDRVKRITTSYGIYQIGDIGTIIGFNGKSLYLSGDPKFSYDPDNFQLVKEEIINTYFIY